MNTNIEVQSFEFYALNRVRNHIKCIDENIHFNNAGASPMPLPVLDKFKEILDREHEIGGYAAAAEYSLDFVKTRRMITKLINAESDNEIALVDSATTAWIRAFYSVNLKKDDIILTCEAEYAANFVAMLQQAKRSGAKIEIIPSDSTGLIDLSVLENSLKNANGAVKVVCLTWIPTNGGLVNPAELVGQLTKKYKALYIVDACQAAGQISIDVERLQCDFLSATGRKYLRGPRGTGFLYARQSILNEMIQSATDDTDRENDSDIKFKRITEPPTLDHFAAPWLSLNKYELSLSARRFEQWESNYAGLCALGLAIEYALDIGLDTINDQICYLAENLRSQLRSLSDKITVHDLGNSNSQCGIVTFSIEDVRSSDIKMTLEASSIYVAVSPFSSTLIDASNRDLPEDGIVRASLHYFNTLEEIERFIRVISDML